VKKVKNFFNRIDRKDHKSYGLARLKQGGAEGYA
jgi:hypothetical protein